MINYVEVKLKFFLSMIKATANLPHHFVADALEVKTT
jgi:hypothetical protein